MKILVVGSGGREHAICLALQKSKQLEKIYCAPGNAGMLLDNIECVDYNNFNELIDFCISKKIDYTIVGPEQPLSEGIVDAFVDAGLKIFGPSKQHSLLESSKSYAKAFMNTNNIPTADYKVFTSYDEAKEYIENSNKFPLVIKADGLAAGKGVVICNTKEDALCTIKDMMIDDIFKGSGKKIVVEEFLEGEEFSLLAFVDNEKYYPMPIAQDHKKALDNDNGLNTGGMGAYCPVNHLSDQVINEAITKVLEPTVKALKSYVGILYCGLMSTKEGVKVIEYNVRFGDPEVQVILPRLTSDLCINIKEMLDHKPTEFTWKKEGVDLGVVVAAKGYPQNYKKNINMDAFKNTSSKVIYANVKEDNGKLYSSGGRILLLETSANTINECQNKIYEELDEIQVEDIFYRHDIGNKGKGE